MTTYMCHMARRHLSPPPEPVDFAALDDGARAAVSRTVSAVPSHRNTVNNGKEL